MSKALEIYKSLSPEQLDLLSKKSIDARFKIKDWLDLLQKLAIYDRFADKRRSQLTGWAIAFGVFAFLSIFLPIATGIMLLFIVTAVLLVLLIIYLVKINTLQKRDLNNGLREFLVPWLVALREEIGKNTYIKLKIHLGKSTDKAWQISEQKHKGWGYPKVSTYMYLFPWLTGEATLADGTIVDWKCSQLIRHRRITKRNARGKIKTKNKYKIKHIVVAKVQMPKATYTLKPDSALAAVSQTPEFYILKNKSKTISTNLEESGHINALLELIAAAYNSVNVLPKAV